MIRSARALAGDIVHLTIEGDEESEEATVEIQIADSREIAPDRRIQFATSQAGVLRFGRQVNGVSVDAPNLDMVIGSGNPVEMVAPVFLNVSRLTFDCSELLVEPSDRATTSEGNGVSDGNGVTIEANELLGSKIVSPPLVRHHAELSVSWPDAMVHPWTRFASGSTRTEGQDIDDALRALRRLVLAFRSHSKGRLARFQDKIEHRRITKGDLGVKIRQHLMQDGILTLEGNMYFLNPSALGNIVGATYHELTLKRFNEKVRQYVSSIPR